MIHFIQTTPSTMIEAAQLASAGAAHGDAVVAEEQTAGIGRGGHSWHSPGAGLYLSIVLRIPATEFAVTMALGLAVQRAVNDLAGVAADIRWPNDVMLNERKLAGILVQPGGGALIAGIGLNVNQESFPADLAPIATSLLIETGRRQSKEDLLHRVIAESLRYARLSRAEIFREFTRQSTWVADKHVEVEGRIRGVTAGLDENGFLLVRTADGTHTVKSGGVRKI